MKIRLRLAVLLALLAVFGAGTLGAQSVDAKPSHAADCVPPSLKDCYNYFQMQAFADKVIPMVVQYFDAKYPNLTRPSAYVYIALGETAYSTCTHLNSDGVRTHYQDSMAYAYCSYDNKIYLGQDQLWDFYHNDGDAAPIVGIAHEWGHNVQQHKGIPQPVTLKDSVRHENQADCVAGAWLRYAGVQNWLEVEDAGSIVSLLKDIASAETPSRDHGDLQERARALNRGLKYGINSCNSFYPKHHIFTAG